MALCSVARSTLTRRSLAKPDEALGHQRRLASPASSLPVTPDSLASWSVMAVTAYLDESENERRYWLGGLICSDAEIDDLELRLETTCLHAHDDYGIPLGAEYHGHKMFHGQDDWEGIYPRARS